MTPQQQIEAWLIENPPEAFIIAKHAVLPLLLDDSGNWIGDADFPSGADYIDSMTGVIDVCGLYAHIN